MELLRNERTTRLGRIGEALAAERLAQHGFSEVQNLNEKRINFPFADLVAVRGGRRFLISVKARTEMRQGGGRRNESYNLIQIRDVANAQLKLNGLTTAEITRRLLREVQLIAVASLGLKRSVPMTLEACRSYECLANDLHDHRLTLDLLND